MCMKRTTLCDCPYRGRQPMSSMRFSSRANQTAQPSPISPPCIDPPTFTCLTSPTSVHSLAIRWQCQHLLLLGQSQFDHPIHCVLQ